MSKAIVPLDPEKINLEIVADYVDSLRDEVEDKGREIGVKDDIIKDLLVVIKDLLDPKVTSIQL